MNAVLVIAGREVREGVRNRWILATTLVLALLALSLAFLGSAPVGAVKASALTVTVVSLSSLTIFLVPLIALILSYDGIVGEAENGTLLLLLAYPVSRWQIVLGKFLGHTAILTFATIIGYGAAGVAVAQGQGWDMEGGRAFAAMIGSSILLGAVFAALGTLVSAAARERSIAAGVGVALWLFFVIVFDMALLGVLVADKTGVLGVDSVAYLLMLNPADVYRLFNLTGFGAVGGLTGMASLSRDLDVAPGVLLAVMVLWIALPLALAGVIFRRRPL